MQAKTDAELLNEYAKDHSDAAFSELVRRYADFVYSAALRQVGDGEQARDAAQIVFTDFARKAGSLRKDTVLIAWLCNAARLAALEQLRADKRRLQRERQSMDLLHSTDETDDWSAVRPVLDQVIAQLADDDRHALLLRFFKNESLAAVGAALGISEDAAQKRVSRALAKIREFLAQRGINTTATALSAALLANGVQAAPSGLAASLATGALTATATTGIPTFSLLKFLTVTKAKAAIVVLALAAAVTGLTLKQRDLRRQLHYAQALVQQQEDEIKTMRAARKPAASLADDMDQSRSNLMDVLRLRAEVTQLRRQLAEQKQARAAVAPAEETNRVALAPEPQINIHCEFITLPTTYGNAGMSGILTEAQRKLALKSLEQLQGADVVTAQQVTTLNGREAQISSADAALAANGYTNTGPTLTVLATCSTDSPAINLSLVAQVPELVNPSSAEDDPSPLVEVTSITNSARVWDGQTLVLSHKLPSQGSLTTRASRTTGVSGPRNLFVFVTPTEIDQAGNRMVSDPGASDDSNPGENVNVSAFHGSIPNRNQ